MEEFDARPERYGPSVIGKYTKGIGQIEGRYPTDDEDPVSQILTIVHRLMERMERDGMNQTAKYNDGVTLNPWNAVGRLDIGSESLIDRSKSMKAFCMDIFERYGNGEHNIEGVDMYNACYGGQAAGLCCQNWVESDRWDGRYGLGCGTDIQDVPYEGMFSAGAACTGSLFYPDAPMAHYSHRVTCIMHRYDFYKPVGWCHMGPVVDGKYSIDAYMNCVEACYHGLKAKMNDRRILEITDYNVFHTGGGYHIVKKAFERFIRAEDVKTIGEVRDKMVQEKLMPSVHLLKIIGPCHTVSSFLNISSCAMHEWDRALGKILCVFTYGSGCASSCYQMRFDDIPWFEPLQTWKVKFYRDSIYQPPSSWLFEPYRLTWMKFDYRPYGRRLFNIPVESYLLDVYHLMEIDPWGRRFYHRGGLRAGPLAPEHRLRYDEIECRGMRERYGPTPLPPEEQKKSLADEWRELEFEMTYDPLEDEEGGGYEIMDEKFVKGNREHKLVVINNKTPSRIAIEKDAQPHQYQVIGSWTCMQTPEPMQELNDGSNVFEVTLGANGWEQFYIIQDYDMNKKIYPAFHRSWKDLPAVGPHKGGKEPMYWMIDGRGVNGLPEEDNGKPGDKYLITFKWENVKHVTWEKMSKAHSVEYHDDATYYIRGSWNCWDLEPMKKDEDEEGTYTLETQLTPLELQFQIIRNKDEMQVIYPDVPPGTLGTKRSRIMGPDEGGKDKLWNITGEQGDMFRIGLHRFQDSLDDVQVRWRKTGNQEVERKQQRYFLIGTMNQWGQGDVFEMSLSADGKSYVCAVQIENIPEEFQIQLSRRADKIIYPDKPQCTQIQQHKVLGPSKADSSLAWGIGKSVADKAKLGSTFVVSIAVGERTIVSWKKRD